MSCCRAHIWPIAHIWARQQQILEHFQSEDLQAIELKPYALGFITGQLALKKIQLFPIIHFNSGVLAIGVAFGAFVMENPLFIWTGYPELQIMAARQGFG
jgi:hypothetical protein